MDILIAALPQALKAGNIQVAILGTGNQLLPPVPAAPALLLSLSKLVPSPCSVMMSDGSCPSPSLCCMCPEQNLTTPQRYCIRSCRGLFQGLTMPVGIDIVLSCIIVSRGLPLDKRQPCNERHTSVLTCLQSSDKYMTRKMSHTHINLAIRGSTSIVQNSPCRAAK